VHDVLNWEMARGVLNVTGTAGLDAADAILAEVDQPESTPVNTRGEVLRMRFQCRHCGEKFALSAGTQGGQGGCWRPVDAGSIHTRL